MHRALPVLCLVLLSASTAHANTRYASAQAMRPEAGTPASLRARVGGAALKGAQNLEAKGRHEQAALAYIGASYILPQLRAPILVRAAQATLKTPETSLASAWFARSDFLDTPVQAGALAQARLHRHVRGALAPIDLLTRAWAQDDASTCQEVLQALSLKDTPVAYDALAKRLGAPGRVLDGVHAFCTTQGTTPATRLVEGYTPSTSARLRRAEVLFGRVRFLAADEELDAIDQSKLKGDEVCRFAFRRARTYYRIKAKRGLSADAYVRAAGACEQSVALHRKSLYGAGKRQYETGKTAQARASFEALLKAHPQSRYADDALYYLAKVARRQGDVTKAQGLLERALEQTPQGDMIFEMAWEQHEGKLRTGQHAAFLAAIKQLKLPPQDNTYFSQGRLEYFQGVSSQALNKTAAANAFFKQAFERYPFSFYGYLSWAKLKRQGVALKLETSSSDSVSGWFPRSWFQTNAGILHTVGLHAWAAQLEQESLPDEPTHPQLWRLALLYDLAGKHPVSHNIARRRIEGRPWAHPVQGRIPRWSIAWPNPFAEVMAKAHKQEQAQHPDLKAHPALALAIMREESGFIPSIESYAGALGLMQLMPRTALGHDKDIPGRATPEALKRPEVNIRVGVDHIFYLSKRMNQHPVLMVSAYNAGAGGVRRWMRKYNAQDIALFIEDIPSFQTRNYTKRVIGSYAAYQWLLGEASFDASVLNDAVLK